MQSRDSQRAYDAGDCAVGVDDHGIDLLADVVWLHRRPAIILVDHGGRWISQVDEVTERDAGAARVMVEHLLANGNFLM